MIPLPLIDAALQACEAAYRPTWSAVVIEQGGAYATVSETDTHLVVAYRGTDEARDWISNFRAYPWRYGKAWVHRGFQAAHSLVWHRIKSEIQRQGTNKPLLVTGHSLGGAMAELSLLFLRDYPQPVDFVAFGKPNVFAKPRAARLQYLETQISVVSGTDPVARIPAIGYGPDLGQSMLYLATRDEQDYWIDSMTDANRRLIRADRDLSAAVGHHSIIEYRRRINRLLDSRQVRS